MYLAELPSTESLLHRQGPSTYPAGLKPSEQGYIRYALPSSANPTLLIVNPIYDNGDGIIMPGYYELALGYERTMMYLIQGGVEVAVIPVFKVEEEKTSNQQEPMDDKSLKKWEKDKKKEEKRLKKLRREERIQTGPQIYSNATIEYDEEKDYYLIKYEKGNIKAYGAIKCH